jgi:formate hydrogenlyase subunit 4
MVFFFTDIFYGFHLSDNNYILIFSVISFYLLIQIVMIENSRMPIDDPKTHLELTMIHEVMILDYSGFDKALLHIGTFLKYGIYGALITAILINTKWSIYIQIFAFFAVVVCLGVIIGLNESFRARNKMGKNPQFVLTLSGIALVAFVIVLLLMGKF